MKTLCDGFLLEWRAVTTDIQRTKTNQNGNERRRRMQRRRPLSEVQPGIEVAIYGTLPVFALALLVAVFSSSAYGQVPAGCTPEQFAEGPVRASDNSRIIETPDYLQFASPVCVSTNYTSMRVSYQLKYSHTVQMIDMEMGSGMSPQFHASPDLPNDNLEMFEWAWWVWLDTPTGHHVEFFSQYDKHSDVRGNENHKIILSHPLTLPAGTVVTINRPYSSSTVYNLNSGNPTGQKVELVGVW
jgi:hypothetical protein